MPDPATIALTIAKYGPTIKKGYDWLSGKKKKIPTAAGNRSNLENRYVNFLQSQSKQGMSNAQQNMIMGDASRGIAQGVNNMQAGIAGRGVMQGLENSAVMGQQAMQADSIGVGQLASTARSIAMKNFDLQQQAQEKLGSIGMNRSAQKYNEAMQRYTGNMANTESLLGDIGKMAGGYLKKKQGKQDLEDYIKAGMDPNDIPPEIMIQIMGG
tara:strand:- start:9450 stop:10085 length:636 start_codon:yes stop_codon:yes gene_type:complete